MTQNTFKLLKPPAELGNDLNIDALNAEFGGLSPEERITRAYEIFGDSLIASTSFGPTSPIMLDLISKQAPDIPVVTIRHGYETEETLEVAKWCETELGITPHKFYAERLAIPVEGTPEFLEFQRKIKIEPFQRIVDELQPRACLFGVIGWQTDERRDMAFVEKRGSLIAINPVLDIRFDEVVNIFVKAGIEQNQNHFDPAKGTSQKLECGLNTAEYTRTSELAKE